MASLSEIAKLCEELTDLAQRLTDLVAEAVEAEAVPAVTWRPNGMLGYWQCGYACADLDGGWRVRTEDGNLLAEGHVDNEIRLWHAQRAAENWVRGYLTTGVVADLGPDPPDPGALAHAETAPREDCSCEGSEE